MPCTAGTRLYEPGKYSVNYDLYTPDVSSNLGFFLLLHGFAGEKAHLRGHAEALVKQGFAVMNVNMSSLMSPSVSSAQERNISQVVGHVQWVLGAFPVIDPARVFLCGHSAGGAVALEATVALRSAGVMVRGVCLLDGVPWPRTETVALSLFKMNAPLSVLSLRSVPGAWNLNGKIKSALDASWEARDLKDSSDGGQDYLDAFIKNSGHGDPINPPVRGFLFSMLGLLGPPRCATIYSQLLQSFAAAGGDLSSPQILEYLNQFSSAEHLQVTRAKL